MSSNLDPISAPVDPISVEHKIESVDDYDKRYQVLLDALKKTNRQRPGNAQHCLLVRKLENFFNPLCDSLQRLHENESFQANERAWRAFNHHRELLVEIAFAYTSIASPPIGVQGADSSLRLYAAEQGLRRHVQLMYIHQLHHLPCPNWWSDLYALASIQRKLSGSNICGYFAVAVALHVVDYYALSRSAVHFLIQVLMEWSQSIELEPFMAPRSRPPYRLRMDFSLDGPPAASGWWQGNDNDELWEIDLGSMAAKATEIMEKHNHYDAVRVAELLDRACGFGHHRSEPRLVCHNACSISLGSDDCFKTVGQRLQSGRPATIVDMSVHGIGLAITPQDRLTEPGEMCAIKVQDQWVIAEICWVRANRPLWRMGCRVIATDIETTFASINGRNVKVFASQRENDFIIVVPAGVGDVGQSLVFTETPARFRLVELLNQTDDLTCYRFELIE